MRRRLATAAAIVLGSAACLVATPAQASSGTLYVGPSPSYGFYNQNDSSDLLRVLANPTGAVPSGKCLDMWYDWSREGGHFDARMARSCRPASQRDSGNTYESTNVFGFNKLFSCYGNNNATTSGTCEIAIGLPADVIVSIPNKCTRSWWLTSTGSYLYDGGGSVTSCTS
ncbi:hypothetical protein O7630_16975 [Micromonospora sp. WMMD718]|uniref:hypothetical protein n=1 Tax=unclassified Micromonospora TaxID=2617518 RepID=UPI00064C1787|nr:MULTISPECIES: hypothetical protein [unclassified Micromonospora]MDG4752638.1 hypothetical protein [Micromonospora sp. WMMD718]